MNTVASQAIKLQFDLVTAYKNGNIDDVNIISNAYLNLAAKNKSAKFYGDAVHQANIISGLVAFDQGDIDKSKEYLLDAIVHKPSPSLKTFGPNMLLAKKLLEVGEKEVVLTFLNSMNKIWQFPFRFFFARNWIKKIKKNEIPDFKANLNRYLTLPPT
ncbi:hypothetical protein [Neolewinella agarilytica]|uniref:hypothetical protein n=1 Tax=Neolewinella agarilytica TaxID=478744 RepID=UPI002353983B|nr:hypothetical protein [Neolewinella agarilytica]